MTNFIPPSPDCPLCPRLAAFRHELRRQHPGWFNAPVPSFGELNAHLMIVGLAPGMKGANASGRPFTGDYAGFILYSSLLKSGFAKGDFLSTLPDVAEARIGEKEEAIFRQHKGTFGLIDCRISNAVRCLPPENKPEPSEIKTCNQFLKNEIAAMSKLKVILTLGLVSHNAVLKAFGLKAAHGKFAHGAMHKLSSGVVMVNSYHCSRYNINTGRLNQDMFDKVVEKIAVILERA